MSVPIFNVDLSSEGRSRSQLTQESQMLLSDKAKKSSPFESAGTSIGREIGSLLRKMKCDEDRLHAPITPDVERNLCDSSRGPSLAKEAHHFHETSGKVSLFSKGHASSEGDPEKQSSRWNAKIDLSIPFNTDAELLGTPVHLPCRSSEHTSTNMHAQSKFQASCFGGCFITPSSSSSSIRRNSNSRQRSRKWLAKQEAWLSNREEKLQSCRNSPDHQIGRFSPRLPVTEGARKPERSPQWWASPQGGGSLHERGRRALARRESRQKRYHEERLADELRECTFAPNISASQRQRSPFPELSARKAEMLRVDASDSMDPGVATITSALNSRVPRPLATSACRVTSERAAEFYEGQMAWRESCLEERWRCLEAQNAAKLEEEARARQPKNEHDPSPPVTRQRTHSSGILSRSVYDRQLCWQQKRDSELEELREAYYAEVMTPQARSESLTAQRRSFSAPRNIPKQSTCEGTSSTLIQQLRSARMRGSHFPTHSERLRPETSKSTSQCCQQSKHSLTVSAREHMSSHKHGVALIQNLQASRMKPQPCSTTTSHTVRSHSAPSTPRGRRHQGDATNFTIESPRDHTQHIMLSNSESPFFTCHSPLGHSVPITVARHIDRSRVSACDSLVAEGAHTDAVCPSTRISCPYHRVSEADMLEQSLAHQHQNSHPKGAVWRNRTDVNEMLHVLTGSA